MLTFSQCIDSAIDEIIRPDLDQAMANYLNATIRELHFTADPSNPMPVGYKSNLVEEALEADSDSGFGWDIPTPRRFQMMEAVFFHTPYRYATERKPSSMRAFESSIGGAEYSYYRSADTYTFNNYGMSESAIDIAYFEYLRPLKYYPDVEARPCEWDEETEAFVYHADYDSTTELRAQARLLCTNWMIERWRDLMLAGIRAKVWARLADEVRMRTAYSSYQNARGQIVSAETYVLTPRYRG